MQFQAIQSKAFGAAIFLLAATTAHAQSFSHFGRYEPDPSARTGGSLYRIYVTSNAASRLVCNARANVTTWNADMKADGETGFQIKTEERGMNRVDPGQTSLIVSINAVAVQDGTYTVNCQPDPLAQQSTTPAAQSTGPNPSQIQAQQQQEQRYQDQLKEQERQRQVAEQARRQAEQQALQRDLDQRTEQQREREVNLQRSRELAASAARQQALKQQQATAGVAAANAQSRAMGNAAVANSVGSLATALSDYSRDKDSDRASAIEQPQEGISWLGGSLRGLQGEWRDERGRLCRLEVDDQTIVMYGPDAKLFFRARLDGNKFSAVVYGSTLKGTPVEIRPSNFRVEESRISFDLPEYSAHVFVTRTGQTNSSASHSPADRLRDLKKLHSEGTITDKEFEAKKAEILKDM